MNSSKVEPAAALVLATRQKSSSPSDMIAPHSFNATLTQANKDLYTIDPELNDPEFFAGCWTLLMKGRGWWGNDRLPPEVRKQYGCFFTPL